MKKDFFIAIKNFRDEAKYDNRRALHQMVPMHCVMHYINYVTDTQVPRR